MDMFEDGYFDLVLSNATLEHDKNFWLTAAEMRRVLHPGGTMIVGVPGYVRDDTKSGEDAILILNHHGPGDYYRLSDEAMHEVVFEGFEDVTITVVPTPPRIIGLGRKPAAADADPQCT
jgi:SAM-dependent methyltransferase